VSLLFPLPIRGDNGRLYFPRSALERHKRRLMGLPEQPAQEPESFVPADQVCREFGIGRRSLGRRIREAQKASVLDRIGAIAVEAVDSQ
jgi:hypothetical protein